VATPEKQVGGPLGATPVENDPVGVVPSAASVGGPLGATPVEEEPSIRQRITGRFLGTDVDDPIWGRRTLTTIPGAYLGGTGGAAAGVALGAMTGPAAPIAVPTLGVAGMLLGGAGGAAAGAMTPEAAMEAAEAVGLLSEGTRDAVGLDAESLRTLAENEALLDAATGGGLTLLRGAGRLSAQVFTGARRPLAERAAQMGVDMMPVVAGDRTVGRGFVAVFGRFPFLGGGVIRRRGGAAEQAFVEHALGAAERVLGPGSRVGPLMDQSELGTLIFQHAEGLVTDLNKFFGARYDDIFARAAAVGARVVPTATLAKADEILNKLGANTPPTFGTPSAGPALDALREFIETSVTTLRTTLPDGGTAVLKPTLEQMDGLIKNIDQHIAALEPAQKKFVMKLLTQLRVAAMSDATLNIRGPGAANIIQELKALNNEFSHTMAQVFETASANRFGTVRRRGLRAMEFPSHATTRVEIDRLVQTLVKLDSPQAMQELAVLVGPDIYRRVAANVVGNAVNLAMRAEGAVGKLDVGVFARQLGLDGANAARRRAVAEMLETASSPVTIKDLEAIVEVGRQLENFDIPNWSSMIARRGQIGGLRAVVQGVIPGIALTGGVAGTVAGHGASFIATLTLLGLSNAFGRIIANPKSARALHTVMSGEVSDVVLRNAYTDVVSAGIHYLQDDGYIGEVEAKDMRNVLTLLLEELDKYREMMTSD